MNRTYIRGLIRDFAFPVALITAGLIGLVVVLVAGTIY